MKKINVHLFNKTKQIMKQHPNFDQQKICSLLIQDTSLRMKKQAIKSGVQTYFIRLNNNHKNELINTIEVVQLNDIPIKRRKQNQCNFQFFNNNQISFQKLAGIDKIKQQVQREILMHIQYCQNWSRLTQIQPNKGFLLIGAQGSGKTVIAHSILAEFMKLQFNCYALPSSQLLTADCQEKLKKVFQAAEDNQPSVIFIDDLDEIFSKEAARKSQNSCISLLCSYIDRIRIQNKNIYLLGCACSSAKLQIICKYGRFYKKINIQNPNESQRSEIIHKLFQKVKHNLSGSQNQLAKICGGYLPIDLVNLCQEAVNNCLERIIQIPKQKHSSIVLEMIDFQKAIKQIQPILKKEGFTTIPTVTLNDVGALQIVKSELIQEIILPMKKQKNFKNINFEVTNGGVMLYGPPGCGKTMLAKAIANQARANFITVKGPELLTKYVGESQQALRKVFERARMSAPCIIFFDQFDALAPKRQDQGNQVTERVVNTLLNEMNGINETKMVFVIAATNRPDIIDQAVLRSGRIQKHLYVPMPNKIQRQQILMKILNKVNKQQKLDLSLIADGTDNFSGADLYFLVKKSIMQAISKQRQILYVKDLEQALVNFKMDKYNNKNERRNEVLGEEIIKQNSSNINKKFQKDKNEIDSQLKYQNILNEFLSNFLEKLNQKKCN